MKDRVTIYEDDEIKVELDRRFYNLIKAIQPRFFKLPDREFDFVLHNVFAILGEQGKIIKKGDKVLSKPKLIGNIPVIRSGRALSLQPPYDCFNEVLHYICLYPTLDDEYYIEAAEDVNEVFGENGFYCYIFPHRIFDVKGFLTFRQDGEDTIMLFGFQDRQQEIDFLDF